MNKRKIALFVILCFIAVLSVAFAYLKGKADGYKIKLIDHGMESYVCLMVENIPNRAGEGLDLIEQNLYRGIYLSEELSNLSFPSVAALAAMDFNSMKEQYYNMVRKYYEKYPEGYHRFFDPYPLDTSMESKLESAVEDLDSETQDIVTQITPIIEQSYDSLTSSIDAQISKERTTIDRVLGIQRD